MHPDRWHRVEALLDGALDLPAADRAAFLQRECAGEPALIAEVMAIIEAGERSDSVLDSSAAKLGAQLVPNDDPAPVPVPKRIGPYRIERLIGEGGMGTVYLARRDDGEFDQEVALKLVRTGLHLDSRIVRRFRDERQILAALNQIVHRDIKPSNISSRRMGARACWTSASRSSCCLTRPARSLWSRGEANGC